MRERWEALAERDGREIGGTHTTRHGVMTEFNGTKQLLSAGAMPTAPMLRSAEHERGTGGGFLNMSDQERRRVCGEDDLSLDQVRERYKGWTSAAIAQELELLELHSMTVYVPHQVPGIREAVLQATSTAHRIGVSAGDYEWADRLVVGGHVSDERLRLAGSVSLPGAGKDEGETRLWGQWAMCSNTWGSMANVTCLFQAETRGGRALFLLTGGTAPFPWVFHSMQARCSGGVGIMLAQRSFLHTTGCVVGGLGGGPMELDETAVYGVMLLENSHVIMHATTAGYCAAAGVRVTGEGVAVLDKCRISDNARGLMASDDVRCLLRKTRFLSNWCSAIDIADGTRQVGALNTAGDVCRVEMLLHTCRVRPVAASTKEQWRRAAAADAAAQHQQPQPQYQTSTTPTSGGSGYGGSIDRHGDGAREGGDGIENVWMGCRLPGWLAEKDNDFALSAPALRVGGSPDGADGALGFRTEVVFQKKRKAFNDQGVTEGMVPVSHLLNAHGQSVEGNPRPLAPPPRALLDWLAMPGVARVAQAAVEGDETGEDVRYVAEEMHWFPRARLQMLLDQHGCRSVMASWEELGKCVWLEPLRVEANSTGFRVRNTTDNQVVVAWDKVEAGRKFEVVVKCPACQRSIRIRSGLVGKVQCPLTGCKAIFARESTAAGVSVVGLGDDVDKVMANSVLGADLNEVDVSTHALLPLPGGKFAVVRRPLLNDDLGPVWSNATCKSTCTQNASISRLAHPLSAASGEEGGASVGRGYLQAMKARQAAYEAAGLAADARDEQHGGGGARLEMTDEQKTAAWMPGNASVSFSLSLPLSSLMVCVCGVLVYCRWVWWE